MPANIRSTKAYLNLQSKLGHKTQRRRALRVGLVVLNVVIVGVIGFFVLQTPHTSSQATATGLDGTADVANPLDQVSSTDIAQTVAQINALPETTAIANQAQSQAAETAIASSNDNVLAKPQVVATALKSRADIKTYVTVGGDTISSVAAKFGITSDSIRWSNNLTGDAVPAGTRLAIPPVNGIIYTVKAGDTAESLAAKYGSNKDQIIAYNDAEISGLHPGEQIIIPNAVQSTSGTAAGLGSGFLWGAGPIYGYNGYDYGYCTWYVATQVPVPANWGNASTWAYYARMSGWDVSKMPTPGAIAQTALAAGGEGHVAIVDGVNGNMIHIRDMNGLAGWGRVGSGWVSASEFQNFISH